MIASVSAALRVGFEARLDGIGRWLATHQHAIRRVQWTVVGIYFALLLIPAALPLPGNTAFIWNDLTRFAQFVFWGVWWPSVILATALFGRVWCGLLCPEGFLSETASARGQGRALPRWVRWSGWPTAAFIVTTLYGQLTSVYQYPRPAALILGGSTLAAIAVGYAYGRNKRVWCRYLCPVSGVFGVLAKLAPLEFTVDQGAWKRSQARHEKPEAVNCAPMLALRTMKGASACHMCGRCSGFRGSIRLASRSPSREIVEIAGTDAKPAETVLILFGLAGLATACFTWSSSPIYAAIRMRLAELAAQFGLLEGLTSSLPWWILTNYPERNDVMLVLDAVSFLTFTLTFATVIAACLACLLAVANLCLARASARSFHHLAQALLPVVACGLFTGLLALPVEQFRIDGLRFDYLGEVKAVLSIGAIGWSSHLAFRVAKLYQTTRPGILGCGFSLTAAAVLAACGSLGLIA